MAKKNKKLLKVLTGENGHLLCDNKKQEIMT